jgi:hypothetical protein
MISMLKVLYKLSIVGKGVDVFQTIVSGVCNRLVVHMFL